MRKINRGAWTTLLVLFVLGLTTAAGRGQEYGKVTVNWEKVIRTSQTTPTLQVVVNPPLRRGTAIHDQVFRALRDIQCDYVRYVPWLPYPRLGVAELEPPKDGKTSWDFSLIDPMTIDFLKATQGHAVILNFSTIPQWMWKTEKPVTFPADPDQVTWNYTQGREPVDPSFQQVADYYARLVSWYTLGGFTDELGVRHNSGYHYKVDFWEVLNEVDFEHQMTPETYTRLYDEVVAAIHRVQPQMKFVGLALASPSNEPKYFEYFLDPKNHKAGIPLDMISYHFYAVPSPDETVDISQYTFFDQAQRFLDMVRYVESIRQRLSPGTRTTIDEIGSIYNSDFGQDNSNYTYYALAESYWNLSAATYAYVYSELAKQGIDVAGESQLVGYPTQFPSVSMVDWNTGQPNARYWALKLIHDNLGPGDKLVETSSSNSYVYAQSFVTRAGTRKILLLSKRNRTFEITLPASDGARLDVVDQTTGTQPPATSSVKDGKITLGGFAVAIVTLAK
ncbi:MAG TPA: glycosyl hydrolase family 39 [Terriglobia bacterium]|nr:glycosyl hydrolase family 39 [Terriglobia bacterium]